MMTGATVTIRTMTRLNSFAIRFTVSRSPFGIKQVTGPANGNCVRFDGSTSILLWLPRNAITTPIVRTPPPQHHLTYDTS